MKGPARKQWSVLIVAIFAVCVVLLVWILSRQQRILNNQRDLELEQERLQDMAAVSNIAPLITGVLASVEDELNRSPRRTLSETTIRRIADLSYSLQPYAKQSQDSMRLSPERAQLLLALTNMDIDSSSFELLARRTSFEGAALRGANLSGRMLNNINLGHADLKHAILRGTSLAGADLRGALLWGGSLDSANLEEADLRRANMDWSTARKANFRNANLDGATLRSGNWRSANLRNASVQWAIVDGAFLTDSDMQRANFLGTRLRNTHLDSCLLQNAQLRQANLIGSSMRHTNITNAEMRGTIVENIDWYRLIAQQNVTGLETVSRRYRIEEHKIGNKTAGMLRRRSNQ